jgi:hypothetical protein
MNFSDSFQTLDSLIVGEKNFFFIISLSYMINIQLFKNYPNQKKFL